MADTRGYFAGALTDDGGGVKMRVVGIAAWSAIVCLVGASAHAATTWNGNSDSEFGTAGNWDNGAPGTPETAATIGNGDTVSNTVDYAGTTTYALTIDGGSTLNSSADFTSDKLTIGDGSTLNLTDGSYSLRRTSGSNNHRKIDFFGSALVSISGGVHTFRERIGMYNSASTFRIIGSTATVNIHQHERFGGTLEMIFDSVGISTYDSDSYIGFHGSLMVDATAYTGRSARFVLVDNDHSASGGFSGGVDITPPDGFSYVFDQSQVQTAGEITLELLESGTIFYDDFATNGLTGAAVKRDNGWAGGSDWAWSSGSLENTSSTRGVGICIPVPAWITTEIKLEVDLEYAVANGASGLSMHLWGLKDVSSGASTDVMNPWGTAGMWYAGGGAFTQYNLKDGATGYNSYSGTAAVQVPSDSGAGLRYNTTVNLASLAAGLSKVSDYDYIAIGFQKHSSAPDLSIEYVSLKALQPSGTMIMVR